MKWFELLRHEYKCETTMLHVPYQGDGKITKHMRDYVVKQLKEETIPALERVSGVKFDIDRLRDNLRESAKAEGDLVKVLETAKLKPSPIDSYFGAIYYVGPMFSAFRGTPEATSYYQALRAEVEQRVKLGQGPVTRRCDGEGALSPGGRGRPAIQACASSGRCSTTKVPWSWPVPIPKWVETTSLASVTIRIILRDARRLLLQLLHQLQSASAHRHADALYQRIPGRWSD